MFHRMRFLILAALMCAGGPSPLPAAEGTPEVSDKVPFLTVQLAGIERTLEDIRRITEISEHPELAVKFDEFLGQWKQVGTSLQGPVVFQLYSNDEDPQSPHFVLALPIAQEKKLQLLMIFSFFGFAPNGNGEGQLTLTSDTQTVHGRWADRLLWLSDESVLLKGAISGWKESAKQREQPLPDVYVLGDFEGLAPDVLQDALRKIDEEEGLSAERRPEEDATAYQVRQIAERLARGAIRSILSDTRKVELTLDVDSDVRAQGQWIARENSALAAFFGQLSLTRIEQRVSSDTQPLKMEIAAQLPAAVCEQLSHAVGLLKEKVRKDLASQLPERERHPAMGIFDALQATIEARRVQSELEFTMNEDGYLSFISYGKWQNVEQAAASLDVVLPHAAPSPDVKSVEMEIIPDGPWHLHGIVPKTVRPIDRAIYGPDLLLFVGSIGQDLVFAVGSPRTIPQILGWHISPVDHPPVLHAQADASPWLELMARERPDDLGLQMVRKSFVAGIDDSIELTVTADANRLSGTLRLEQGFLRLLGDIYADEIPFHSGGE